MSGTPDVNDVRERVARIVYAFGYANGAFMWPWESASSGAQQDARSHADAILDGHVLVKADGLSHGDELVPEMLLSGGPTGRYWVRRSVPENGDT